MATVTITTTAPQDARLAPAYGYKLGLKDASGNPRNATTADVKAYLIDVLQADVRNYEYEQAKEGIVTTVFAPT